MQFFSHVLFQLDEARRYIDDGRLQHLRLAFLILDNAVEIQMDRRMEGYSAAEVSGILANENGRAYPVGTVRRMKCEIRKRYLEELQLIAKTPFATKLTQILGHMDPSR